MAAAPAAVAAPAAAAAVAAVALEAAGLAAAGVSARLQGRSCSAASPRRRLRGGAHSTPNPNPNPGPNPKPKPNQGAFWAFVILGEQFTYHQISGAVALIGAILLSIPRPENSRPAEST